MAADKKCPNCGACKECGAQPYRAWWGVIPPQPHYPYAPNTTPYIRPHYPTLTITSNTSTSWGNSASSGLH